MIFDWKENWAESRERHLGWWRHTDSVLVTGATPREAARPTGESARGKAPPTYRRSDPRFYTDTRARAARNHLRLAGHDYPADTLPIADADIGPGSLALLAGSEPGFAEGTVWFEPFVGPETDPASDVGFSFDESNRWWQVHRETLSGEAELGGANYLAGCPDLVENIDILAALRGSQQLLIDMIEEPEWVDRKVAELNEVWFETYDRIFEIISRDGGACFHAFHLWGPGKTAKVQCDACAMFSPAMFDRFVLPSLTGQCARLDYSIYHLDGHQCLPHLDSLLAIAELDAIEWTPDPRVPSGGNAHWYELYKRILDAGKSVQAVGVKAEEVVPLLEAVGHRGMFIMTRGLDAEEAAELIRATEGLRRG